jgi:ankyrin repeat protein
MPVPVPRVVGALIVLLAGSSIHAAEIHTAVEAEDMAKLEQILAGNPDLVNMQDNVGVTPLHYAAGLNNTNLVEYLISKGANVKAASKQGWTPLHWAAHMNAAEVVAQLVAKGADPEAKAIDGKTPLQVAVVENSQAVIAMLAKKTSVVYTDTSLEASYQLAQNAITKGDLKQAYELYGKLVNEDPANDNYNFAYGMTCQGIFARTVRL